MLNFALLYVACSNRVPDLEHVQRQFTKMHPVVYQIYKDRIEERQLHRLLSSVFVGNKLTLEYIEHFSTLHHMGVEQTSIAVKQVDYNSIRILEFDFGEVKLDVDWSVGGVVTHQGHKHTRVNRYRAVYTLLEVGEREWRISDVKMRNAERIRRATDEDILNGTNAGGGYLDPMDLLEAGMYDLPDRDEEATEDNRAREIE